MNLRVLVVAILAGVVFVACGAGGGSSSTPPVPNVPAPATPNPNSNSANLISTDVFALHYAGQKTITDVYTYGSGPLGSPSPNPPTTQQYSVQTSVQAALNVAPTQVVIPGPYLDVQATEDDASSLSTQEVVTDAWIGAPGQGFVYEYGMQQTQPLTSEQPIALTNFADPTTFASNAQRIDSLPETPGASWSNVPSSTFTEKFADGHTIQRTINADGSYTDVTTALQGSGSANAVSIIENSDGSGSYTAPFASGNITEVVISAPVLPTPEPSSTPDPSLQPQVTITVDFTGNYASIFGPSMSNEYPPFYAFSPEPVLYTETDAIAAAATLPAQCANSYGMSGTKLDRTITTLDTILGYVETTDYATYEAAGYPVCTVLDDVINYAYDYAGDTVGGLGGFLFGLLGGRITTTSQTLVLAPGAKGMSPGLAHRQTMGVFKPASMFAAISASMQASALQRIAQHRRRVLQTGWK